MSKPTNVIQIQTELSQEQLEKLISEISSIFDEKVNTLNYKLEELSGKIESQAAVKYLDMAGMQEKLKVERSTIYGWINKGLLPQGKKIGGSTRWNEAEVDAYISGNSSHAEPLIDKA